MQSTQIGVVLWTICKCLCGQFIFNNLDKIIYVVNLFIFNNLDEIIYDQVQMGDHLLSCLDMGQTHPFTKFRACDCPVAYLKRTKYTSVLSCNGCFRLFTKIKKRFQNNF